MLAVLLENSGLMKAGPRQAEFEPAAGKTYKFSDVHGVDEVKDVSVFIQLQIWQCVDIASVGVVRSR